MTTAKATTKGHKPAYLMSKNNDYMCTVRLARAVFILFLHIFSPLCQTTTAAVTKTSH